MTINLKRNLVLLSFLSLGLMACGSKSSDPASDNNPPPQGPAKPAGPTAPKDVDLQGTAFGHSFVAKGALAINQKDHIVLLISSDDVQDCGGMTLGSSGINLTIPKKQAGPFNETNLKAPQFLQVDAEDPSALNGIKDFVTFDIEVLQLVESEISLSLELRDDVGGVVSGNIKAKICP